MALKVLIIPDKFKGTLTAQAAARAMARGWRRARPLDRLELVPMCDGGDGFGEVMSGLVGGQVQRVRTLDAAHRPCTSCWWWMPQRKLALVESARVIGLAMLPAGEFHPFELDTFGLGVVLRAAADKGVQRCLLGIGGSATNDGGFGLARALGWQFLDRAANAIQHWTGLTGLARIRPPRRCRWFRHLTVAVDVRNPLLGRHGATRVYGPQKGLRPKDFTHAERCLHRLAQVAREHFQEDFARVPGAGAAGGLGFGLLAFLGAELEPGFELFAREARLEQRLRGADLVLTGEGALDRQTFMGKGAGRIAQRCRRLGIPCLGLAGMRAPGTASSGLFAAVHALTDLTGPTQARAHAATWLERLARRTAMAWCRKPSRVAMGAGTPAD